MKPMLSLSGTPGKDDLSGTGAGAAGARSGQVGVWSAVACPGRTGRPQPGQKTVTPDTVGSGRSPSTGDNRAIAPAHSDSRGQRAGPGESHTRSKRRPSSGEWVWS